jgi:hypothetical protein
MDRTASHMARKPASKPGTPHREKVQLSLLESQAKRLRIVAAELGLDMSEVVGQLIDGKYSGVHVRGLDKSDQAGQGRAGDSEPTAPVVKISGITNRIGDIARRASAPHDDALDGLVSD